MQLLTILIADGDALTRSVLKHVLSCTGHRLVEASNGFDALSVLEREHRDGHDVDILFVGRLTPGCTAQDVVERLAAGVHRPCVILVRGPLDVHPQLPVDSFPYLATLTKPFNWCELTKHLVQAMEIRQGVEEIGTVQYG